MKDERPELHVGSLVQVWDALYSVETWDFFDAFLVPHHGKVGIIVGVGDMTKDFHSFLVDGEVELYHTDNLRRVPRDV